MKKLAEKIVYPHMQETVYRCYLADGSPLVLIPRPDFKEIYGLVAVGFGGAHTEFIRLETGERVSYPKGAAHFLEHKLFEKEWQKDLLTVFAQEGADANAYTSWSQTCYLFSTTQDPIAAFKLLQQLVDEPYFTTEALVREREIIGQELEMYLDDPDARLYSLLLENLYPDSALAADIVGSRESIGQIEVSTLYQLVEDLYTPSNRTFLLVGGFDLETVLEELGCQSCQQNVKKNSLLTLPVEKKEVVVSRRLEMEVVSPKLGLGFRGNETVATGHVVKTGMELDLFFNLLYGWMSPLHQELYDSGQMEGSLAVQVEVTAGFHHVLLTLDTKEPITVASKIRQLLTKWETIKVIGEEQFELVKREMYGELLQHLGSLEWVASHFLQDGPEEPCLFDWPALLSSLQLEEVLDRGRQFLESCDQTECIIFPKIS